MVNRLHLGHAELDAMRELQAGMSQPDPRDPIWDMLAMVKLVELTAAQPRLTLLGRLYRID